MVLMNGERWMARVVSSGRRVPARSSGVCGNGTETVFFGEKKGKIRGSGARAAPRHIEFRSEIVECLLEGGPQNVRGSGVSYSL